jgi:hypothetical protein
MKDTNNKQRKIISVFYEEYRKKILTEFDFEAVVNSAMVETIDGKKVKIDGIDKEKRRIYGFIYDEKKNEWGTMCWWDENGYRLSDEKDIKNLAILNYASLVKNEVKKDKFKKIIKPFNIDAVLNGALVETKNGDKVEIDFVINHPEMANSIFGYIFFNNRETHDNYTGWHVDGRYLDFTNDGKDLVIVEYVEDNSKTDNIGINYDGIKINIENNNDYVQVKIIKPFNLDAVRKGAQMETKNGNRVILDHIEDKPNKFGERLCGLEQSRTGSSVYWWCADGRKFKNEDNDRDLVIVEYVQIRGNKSKAKLIVIDGLEINLS